ncbi:MAG TPA: hypothetical protein DEB63_06395 [Agrobacterium sp.]|nr:hypothetical protein [Agrobacterium sp.]
MLKCANLSCVMPDLIRYDATACAHWKKTPAIGDVIAMDPDPLRCGGACCHGVAKLKAPSLQHRFERVRDQGDDGGNIFPHCLPIRE